MLRTLHPKERTKVNGRRVWFNFSLALVPFLLIGLVAYWILAMVGVVKPKQHLDDVMATTLPGPD
ncbi:MAG: hypothetical protein WC243_04270 [Patescibacteria group bacterium]